MPSDSTQSSGRPDGTHSTSTTPAPPAESDPAELGGSTHAPSSLEPQRHRDAAPPQPKTSADEPQVDEFGLPIVKRPPRSRASSNGGEPADLEDPGEAELETIIDEQSGRIVFRPRRRSRSVTQKEGPQTQRHDDAQETKPEAATGKESTAEPTEEPRAKDDVGTTMEGSKPMSRSSSTRSTSRAGSDGFVSAAASRTSSPAPASHQPAVRPASRRSGTASPSVGVVAHEKDAEDNGGREPTGPKRPSRPTTLSRPMTEEAVKDHAPSPQSSSKRSRAGTAAQRASVGVSEWSHQALAPRPDSSAAAPAADEWQAMPALGKYDHYDDEGRLVAKGDREYDSDGSEGGGAKKGYTRVQDDDARSATSMDDDTRYLFKEVDGTDLVADEEQRDQVAQMQATKDLLTEGQRIAYVGVTRLALAEMVKRLEKIGEGEAKLGRETRKMLAATLEAMKKWGQKMMVRLYAHMDIDSSGMNERPYCRLLEAYNLQNRS